ncbi:malonyl-CoA synthase [Roseobacter sp. AzwK-3b]|uniref:zinc ABC transporter substrate-binding protein n=1 Tax=Roseobacter sp. AzwK-3b TaxID=351016 RepID=UPI000156AB9F|nr:zinc ABC transporter substrate-binding protein [Roseobacter sp. AzwK-3b]EDM70151.1 malonyl-CoA synthase [Roseobacter sp. AzwK-3b]
MRLASPVLAALCLAITGAAHADTPRVVADIAPVQSLVARVMDGAGAPELLIRPDASPHAYAMRPSEARALEQADLVVWMGPGLTPWMTDAIQTLAGDAAHLTLLTAPETLVLPGRIDPRFAAHDHGHDHAGHDDHKHDDHAGHDHDDHKHDDHAGHDHDDHKHDDHAGHDHDKAKHDDHAGHDHDKAKHDDHAGHSHDTHDHAHAGPDPHAWLDPVNAVAWLGLIARDLSAIDPDNADLYAANAKAAQAELTALSDQIAVDLAPLADRPFLVFHDAYQYFEARFGVTAAGAVSISDASEPGPARLADLRALVSEQDVACIFAEPQFNTAILASVFGDALRIGQLDPIGVDHVAGPGSYPAMLRGMADAMTECLSPQG